MLLFSIHIFHRHITKTPRRQILQARLPLFCQESKLTLELSVLTPGVDVKNVPLDMGLN